MVVTVPILLAVFFVIVALKNNGVCKSLGGVVFIPPCNGYCSADAYKPVCMFQYRDIGKECTDAKQCKGFCKLTSLIDKTSQAKTLFSPLTCVGGTCRGACSGVSDDYYDCIKVEKGEAIDDSWQRPM